MRAGAVHRWLPGVEMVRKYERSWFRDDAIAGVVLTALLIPAGIGYAQAAGLPPEAGLYAFSYTITVTNTASVSVQLICLLYTSPSPRDRTRSRMPSSA